jgi:IS4 transposase
LSLARDIGVIGWRRGEAGMGSGRGGILGPMVKRFVEGSALPVMVQVAMENALSPEALNAVFERTAVQQYTRDLLFSDLVNLMISVVSGARTSLHAAYQEALDQLHVSAASVYNKLNGLEPKVSAALVRHASEQFQPVIMAMGGQLPELLPGYRLKILDGNHLAATERRLKVLRRSKAGPLPGQALVVLDPALMQAIDIIPCEDGHAQERSLTDEILSLVQKRDVWLDDRNFCTTRILFGINARKAYFITRQHATSVRWESLGRRRQRGRIETGTVFEEKVRLTDPENPETTLVVRRITVVLDSPTRDGEREIHILTNLPIGDAPAQKVGDLYRKRWTLETMFQELEAELCSEICTLGYPRAALFAFSVALTAYNVLSAVKAALRAQYGPERIEKEVSNFYLAMELRATYQGMCIAIPESEWAPFREMTPAQLGSTLKNMAASINLAKFRKHPRGPKKPVPPRTRFRNHSHVSTARLLASTRNAP